MKLSESEKANPQDYFLQSGVDGEGNPIYNLLHEFVDDYLPFKSIRKKVFDGQADIVIQSDTIQIYWKSNLIAEAQLDGQVEVAPDDWQGQLFSFADANISKITEVDDGEGGTIPITPFYRAYVVKDIPALGITDAVLGLDIHWAFKDTKLSFYLDAPGFNARIRWQCRVKDSAVAWTDNTDPKNPIYHKGLSFNVSDYEGAVNKGSMADPEPGWTIHWWTFEPDGKQIDTADARTPKERYEQGVGLVVDPYLTVDEQATYIDVACDGYLMNFPIDDTVGPIIRIYDPTKATYWSYFHFQFWDDSESYNYQLGFDSNLVVEVIENTPNRVKIRIKGQLDRTSGGTDNYLANLDYIECIIIIYPDRFVTDFIWEVSGTITHDSSDGAEMGSAMGQTANLTSENTVYENSGSESDASQGTNYDSADYIGWTASELNYQLITLYEDWGSQYHQRSRANDGEVVIANWDNIVAGTYKAVLMHILDSASREGSAKIYNSTDRLAMGDQYKDAILDQSPSKGDDVTDMIFPARISSGTLHADGAHHYEPDGNDETKITLDTTRLRPSFVIHDWPFQYGTVASPTSILLNHLKMDDNAANNTLLAEVGPNGTWHAVSDGAARNTNTSGDSVAANNFRGRALDTQDGTGYAQLAVGGATVHDNAFLKKGSVIIKITPNFGYDDGSVQVFLHLKYDSSNEIAIYYDSSTDQIRLGIIWGGTTVYEQFAPYTENYSLQMPHVIMASWDSDKDLILIKIDSKCRFDINSGSPTSSDPTDFSIGAYVARGSPADIIIDEIKTFSECLLPYGAYFIGNGQGLLADIDNPHADLCFFWDAQSTAAKGGSNLATSKTGTNTNGQFVSGAALVGTYGWDANGYTADVVWTVNNKDIIDPSKGAVIIPINFQATDSSWRYIFNYYVDANNYIYIAINTDNTVAFQYTSQGTTEAMYTLLSPTTGIWYWLKATWDDTGYIHFYVNGQEVGTPQSVANTFQDTTGKNLRIGNTNDSADCYIGRVFITNNPDTPEIWTAFGKPLHIPLIDKQ